LLWLAIALPPLAARAQDAPLFTSDFPPGEFAQRRGKLMDRIGREAIALIQGAPSPPGYVRFRQSNDFYYLSGVESPHAYLVLDGARRRTALFLPRRDERRERSEGKRLSAEDAELVLKLTGVDEVYATDALADHLARHARAGFHLLTPRSPAEGLATSRDLARRAVADAAADPLDGRPARESHLEQRLRERFPRLEVSDLTPTLDGLRLVKSPREIALIKKATRLACLGILEAMRSTAPGLWEHELDALAKFFFYRHGAQGDAYYSLIASGENAWYPHYHAGARQMKDGELLLMDYAPDVGYYMSDVTRMWPVNGRFSPAQRELYGFYLGCYRAILEAIRPGRTAAAIKEEAAAVMDRLLASSKFSKPAYERAARDFVTSYKPSGSRPARLGHWVGMATHDVGQDTGPLRAGMVFTIEPALRVPEEKVYIRLEDLIVIHEDRAENVSEWLPMDMDAIERVMQEEGLLQRYPRDSGGPPR
jgi:Xaa-Pro aminopeptidase